METQKKSQVVLSDRMQAIVNLVTPGRTVADVGCDHGFISIYLIEQEIAPRVIAMDVNDGPLLRAKEHVEEKGLENKITIKKSDGLKNLEWIYNGILEAGCVIIAGMGGRLTVKILEDSMEKLPYLKELILEPQSDLPMVRRFLWKHGFVMMKEDMVEEDGKYYQIMKAVRRENIGYEDPYTEYLVYDTLAAKYGPVLLSESHPVMRAYLLREKNKYTEILAGMKENGLTDENEQVIKVNEELKLIDKALLFFK